MMVVVPLPIGLPLGREKAEFVFRGGRNVSATRTLAHKARVWAGCGAGPCAWRCEASTMRGW